MQENMSADEKR